MEHPLASEIRNNKTHKLPCSGRVSNQLHQDLAGPTLEVGVSLDSKINQLDLEPALVSDQSEVEQTHH